jgi:serine/threonine-protein kinase
MWPTTFAGSGAKGAVNGTGTAASFNGTTGVAVDLSGNVYVADYGNGIIREITPAGAVTTVAGTAGSASSIYYFTNPYGVAVDASGNIYVAVYGANAVEKITRPTALAARNKRINKK